jgi:prepilin-type N-terminal cleavage/methylation domain-containing protein
MKGNNKKSKKGFTLIELLVVIAIIAILSVVVILTLNPAELLRQSRDSNRISDLSVLKSAISFYLVSYPTPVIGTSTWCYIGSANATSAAGCFKFFQTATGAGSQVVSSTGRTVDSNGWIPINFNAITAGGSPIGSLPIDPLNNDNVHFYAYDASSTGQVFKLDAHMESAKYSFGGTNDVVSTDGGNDTSSYEVGTNLQL